MHRHWFQTVVVAALLFCGCKSESSTKTVPIPENAILGNGYALLFDLLGDEKDISKLLIIKRAHPDLNSLVKEISKTCGDAHKRMAEFGKSDPRINLQNQGLPLAEIAARKAISKTKSRELLTEKGKDFEVLLLLSQSEALTYGAHLARVISEAESDSNRAQFLREVSTELTRLQGKVLETFFRKYAWQ